MSFGVPPQPQGPWQQQGQQPGYQQPGYQQPGYQQPGYQQPVDDGLGLIVPINVRNGLAFASGYLGIFSFFLGPVLGVPAIATGILALRKPHLGGQGRAWTGIVLGGITTLFYGGLILLMFVRAR
jgi:hypothetical protein